jgi:hypothetical protein
MAYMCPRCGAVSHNPHDEANRYCGRCHKFEEDDEQLHRLLGAEALDFFHPFGRTETVVVDDGGMRKGLTPFRIEGYDSPIYGRAVVSGTRDSRWKRCTRW